MKKVYENESNITIMSVNKKINEQKKFEEIYELKKINEQKKFEGIYELKNIIMFKKIVDLSYDVKIFLSNNKILFIRYDVYRLGELTIALAPIGNDK
jgi:hypothetical protein